MKDPALEPVVNPLSEARRYVDNAKQTLQEHGQLDIKSRLYMDDKYVRSAGNFLWYAMIIMMDAVFNVKTSHHPHPDINDYKAAVAQRDRKLLAYVVAAYDTMHISMGYDGNPSKKVCDEGFRLANHIIDRCASMLPS